MLIPRKKRCTKCGELKPCTKEYYNKAKNGKWGYRSKCKECIKKESKQYREKHKEEIKEYKKQYREEHKEEIAEYQKQYYSENKEYHKQYRETHKEEIKEYKKQYNDEHKEYYKEYGKQYYNENKEYYKEYYKKYYDENKEYKKQYNDEHKEYYKEYYKEYRKTEQGKLVIRRVNHNRRAKLNKAEGTYTNEQWIEMMQYFDYKCAYSGEELIEGVNYSIDHILAFENGGNNYIWNLCPMVKSYNSSKKDSLILEWYEQQPYYSEERLIKIYEWVEYAYNKWGKIND
ncbi:MAG: hypothetical protein SOZ95_05775 [Bacilli bacterium]|nr:hypothetical protein [Bacilli bacterium]